MITWVLNDGVGAIGHGTQSNAATGLPYVRTNFITVRWVGIFLVIEYSFIRKESRKALKRAPSKGRA